MVRTEIALRNAGMGGIRGLYKSYSSLGFRHGTRNGLLYTPKLVRQKSGSINDNAPKSPGLGPALAINQYTDLLYAFNVDTSTLLEYHGFLLILKAVIAVIGCEL
jgi:hypothetical protein